MSYFEKMRKWEKDRREICKLRAKGWTFEKIGQKLGRSRQGVHNIYKKAREDK